MPDGVDQPFSKAMITHFDKLQTPLGAARKYPTTAAQKNRFIDLGWSSASVCNLWEMWSDPAFVSLADRKHLDSLEPFDEWEEFALFGCHYFLLVADSSLRSPYPCFGTNLEQSSNPIGTFKRLEVAYSEYPKAQGCRRFAASIPVRRREGTKDRVGIFGGMGLKTRTNTYDVYTNNPLQVGPSASRGPSVVPSPRMCHTITDLGEMGALLVGGRTSPDSGLADCWLYHRWLDIWERVDDLPYSLYRHEAVNLGNGHVLISTGRIDSHLISNNFLVWSRSFGWTVCKSSGVVPSPTYGAVFAGSESETIKDLSSPRVGILAGGICTDALLHEDIWQWTITDFSSKVCTSREPSRQSITLLWMHSSSLNER